MFRKILLMITMVISILALSFVVGAQDDDRLIPVTLEELTENPGDYHGETVIMEGFVMEYVNVNSFVLHENATLDDDQILVINNSGSTFPADLFSGSPVIVTGVIHPSLQFSNQQENDENAEATPVPPEATAEASTSTPEATSTPQTTDDIELDMTSSGITRYLSGGFPDAYDSLTVIEITDIDDLDRAEESE